MPLHVHKHCHKSLYHFQVTYHTPYITNPPSKLERVRQVKSIKIDCNPVLFATMGNDRDTESGEKLILALSFINGELVYHDRQM